MTKLEIKSIKGNKYLYIKDKVKVNGKNKPILLYIGRFEKVDLEYLMSKLGELQIIKLKTFTDFWLKRLPQYLNEQQALDLEMIHYNYQLYREYFPDDIEAYSNSVFARYVQGTTAIEGNTITQKQADELLEHGVTPAGKSIREVYEIMNFRKLRDYLRHYDGDVSEKFIKQIHAIITADLLESAGVYRRIQVLIEKAEHEPPPAFEIAELMEELIRWYRQNRNKMNPFELAVLLHTKFVTIHSFVDGNGRVARALLNFVLESNGYPALYLGLLQRNAYLDAVAQGNYKNHENHAPLVGLLYDIYAEQHDKVLGDVSDRMQKGEVGAFPEMEKLVEEFVGLKNG